jgi:D-tyrosyl-tRNA(Tyr) deacylase
MRAVVQRVREASCEVNGKLVGSIGAGMVVFLGVGREDELVDVEYLAEKIANLRIFADEKDKMNLSLSQVRGEVLVIPQFTLYGDCRKGLRPDFIEAAPPNLARRFYLKFVTLMKEKVTAVKEGRFGAKMRIKVDNDGPVTLILSSGDTF